MYFLMVINHFYPLLLTIGTPLWRNGPPDKPVLCNACGSRWRTKGTLLNYTPLHARADPADYEVHRAGGAAKSISINRNKILKRKHINDNLVMNEGTPVDCHTGVPKFVEEDMSNRSSSGSAMSNSELHLESVDTSDLTGPAQSVVWDSMVPSRKRTCVNRLKQSSVEKLTKDLRAIMHAQQSSCFSGSSEEDLLFESSTPMCSFEIGHGTVILRDPGSIAREEESEASSLSVDRKQCIASASRSLIPPPNRSLKVSIFPSLSPSPRMEKIKRTTEQGSGQEQKRDTTEERENMQILGNHNSALRTVNLKDVITIEEFMKHFTYEEEQELLKYLPSDKAQLPDSLKSLFDSSEFKENLSAFPQLLAEGFSSGSLSGAKVEDCKTLKKLTLFSLMKRKEVESCNSLEDSKNSSKSSFVGPSTLHATESSNLVGGKRPYDIQNQNFPEAKIMMSPKRPVKGNCENKEFMEGDGSCFSPRSLFAFPTDGSAFMLDSSTIIDRNSDHGLLFDIPSSCSFPQAELLHPAPSSGSQSHQASTSSSSIHQHHFMYPH
ncbi:hypothetical protein SAY87_030892 [Trapa incisa]|uniref:DEUBAD domain-containing protein n=1 Tax=Trapa incisa TaxID=236973 RepID=A0AAN7QNZ6_9MYRT|nr:hypothetical protein SAY87_030892 [Trapa incisa]